MNRNQSRLEFNCIHVQQARSLSFIGSEQLASQSGWPGLLTNPCQASWLMRAVHVLGQWLASQLYDWLHVCLRRIKHWIIIWYELQAYSNWREQYDTNYIWYDILPGVYIRQPGLPNCHLYAVCHTWNNKERCMNYNNHMTWITSL